MNANKPTIGILSVLSALVLFLFAGTINFWQGWGLLISILFAFFIFLIIYKNNTNLLKKRISYSWNRFSSLNKYFLFIFGIASFAIPVVAALDFRFGFTAFDFPVWVYLLSYFYFFMGFAVTLWSVKVNKFFSGNAEYVVTKGPYSFIRHPAYSAALLSIPSIGGILGSAYAGIPALAVFVSVIFITYFEDRKLQNKLDGYKKYSEKVKYRLFWGIW